MRPPDWFDPYHCALERRRRCTAQAEEGVFDVAVIGGGISGAAAFAALAGSGYRVILLEKGDFASATSQASAMMIWGGLLYLTNWHLGTVRSLCRSREELVESHPSVDRRSFCLLSLRRGGHSRWLLQGALWLYWILAGAGGRRPGPAGSLAELSWLKAGLFRRPLRYDEAVARPSDARFVLSFVLESRHPAAPAFNHCEVRGLEGPSRSGLWRLDAFDSVLQRPLRLRARWIVNAAGIWTDGLNQQVGVVSPIRHIAAKGVFISFRREDEHRHPLIFDTGRHSTTFGLLPWGPVALWGPTETRCRPDETGYRVEPGEIAFLLAEWNRNARAPRNVDDIVSVRCGVRPLAARPGEEGTDTLSLQRRYFLFCDPRRQWVAVYGGKLTGCLQLGREVRKLLLRHVAPNGKPVKRRANGVYRAVDLGLPFSVPEPGWCLQEEDCWTLDDYLRRRSNVAQWIPRCGLGACDEHLPLLEALAEQFAPSRRAACAHLEAYVARVRSDFDELIASAQKVEHDRPDVFATLVPTSVRDFDRALLQGL